ncbi:MAG: hypothetical protein GTO02_17350 [Candidatus Dadabacteria bacterium]|nr:hypothetical protein [Candidatus Dadabacteria bacterium]
MSKFYNVLNLPEFYIVIYAFLLNFIWELMQLPLFTGYEDAVYFSTVLHCTKATLGDVIISLVAFLFASLIANSRKWILLRSIHGTAVFIITGLVITVVFEILATGPLDRWTYTDSMPLVPFLNVGLFPLMQWIIIPIIQIWFVRRMILSGETIA